MQTKKDLKELPESYWREKLTSEQYRVLREAGTDLPFTGEYVGLKEAGLYTCAACGNELFSSETKFDSKSGWPSFFAAISDDRIELKDDNSHGMNRIEVRCGNCASHLGHLFSDGPRPTGNRYCLNSTSLNFVSS